MNTDRDVIPRRILPDARIPLSLSCNSAKYTYLPGRVSATATLCVHPFCHNKASERARAIPWWRRYLYFTRLLSTTAFLADRSLALSFVPLPLLRSRRSPEMCHLLLASLATAVKLIAVRPPFVPPLCHFNNVTDTPTHTYMHITDTHTVPVTSSRSREHRPFLSSPPRLLNRADVALAPSDLYISSYRLSVSEMRQ